MHDGKTECMLFGTGPKLALISINGKHSIAFLNINILGLFSMHRSHGIRTLIT